MSISCGSAGLDSSNVTDRCICRNIAHKMEKRPNMCVGMIVFPKTVTFKVPAVNRKDTEDYHLVLRQNSELGHSETCIW